MPLAGKQKGSPEITSGPLQLKGRAVPWLSLTLLVTALKEIWRVSRNQRLPSPAPRKDQPWVNLSWQLEKPRPRSLSSFPPPALPGTLRTRAGGWQRWPRAVQAPRLRLGLPKHTWRCPAPLSRGKGRSWGAHTYNTGFPKYWDKPLLVQPACCSLSGYTKVNAAWKSY